MSYSPFKRRLWIGAATVALLLIVAAGVFAAYTWSTVNRVTIDRPASDESDVLVANDNESDAGDAQDDDQFEVVDPGRQVFLLVGSDSRKDLTDTSGFGDFEGSRADVVMVLFKEPTKTGLLSIPRDLLVENPCSGIPSKVGEMLGGCDAYNGPTLLTLAVEDLIEQQVDHFAMVEFDGFREAVDILGGYEICVENNVRDIRANLDLPAGCTQADGDQTLAWLRSRRTQELTDNGWRTMSRVNDLVRNQRQRTFLIDMMSRIGDVSSPQAMMSSGRTLAPYITVDSELSLMDAVNLALTMRGLESGEIVELEIPVVDDTTENGAAVLHASRPVREIVADFLAGTDEDANVQLGVTARTHMSVLTQ
ncbi:MAG TPA: LCP family protein [Acidimicrobiia bacterium]|nr:LCP family protein [Acidimicrobiia bacterium]